MIDTIDRYYEKYIIIDGKYNIEYSKRWTHSIDVNDEMNRLKIGNKNFEPKIMENHLTGSSNTLILKGTGHFHRESRLRMIFDSEWNEVGVEELPYLSFEEDPQEILEHDQLTKEDSKDERELEILKSKIFKRPNDILRVYNEDFKVTERAVIFKPMYKVSVSHIESKKKATFLIDGSTGKIISKQKRKLKPSKDDFKEISVEANVILKNQTEKINIILNKIRKRTLILIKNVLKR